MNAIGVGNTLKALIKQKTGDYFEFSVRYGLPGKIILSQMHTFYK